MVFKRMLLTMHTSRILSIPIHRLVRAIRGVSYIPSAAEIPYICTEMMSSIDLYESRYLYTKNMHPIGTARVTNSSISLTIFG